MPTLTSLSRVSISARLREARSKNNQSSAFSTKLNTKRARISIIFEALKFYTKKGQICTQKILVINSILGVFGTWDCLFGIWSGVFCIYDGVCGIWDLLALLQEQRHRCGSRGDSCLVGDILLDSTLIRRYSWNAHPPYCQ